MEVLPYSGTSYIGESECPEQGPEDAFKHEGKSDFQDMEQHTADFKDNGLNNLGESQVVSEDGGQLTLENVPNSEVSLNEDDYGSDIDGQNLSFGSHDSEDDNSDKRDHFGGPDVVLDSDTVEIGLPHNNLERPSRSGIKNTEQDEPQAVWVKWRGKWQAGIRCARADWPLSTLRAKPTHDRKQYLVIFFPRTRNYSWADVLLVRPIIEFPQPIAYKTHKIGAKTVNDLNLARRYIMQKLAVSMLNILDQLPREALVEAACNVMVLKEFAMEASRCRDYSDLGRMLLKLRNMILERCLASDWLQQSLQSWSERCQGATSAECIEMLKEELADSILWNEVNSVSSEAAQLQLGSEWKSWKHEVMKWFSVSHPVDSAVSSDQPQNNNNNNSPSTMEIQMNRKRPKLEIRRADTHASSSHQSVHSQTDLTYFNSYDANTVSMDYELPEKEICTVNNAVLAGSAGVLANKWDDIIVEAGNLEVIPNKDVESTPVNAVSQKSPGSGRQCIAFIEAKGRQCVRYANEGSVFCCVHLGSSFGENTAKASETPPTESTMCGGTTVLGTKCKHRALVGSSFCKKHRPHDGKMVTSPSNPLKRKSDEITTYPESKTPTKYLLAGEYRTPTQVIQQLNMGKGSTAENSDEIVQCVGTLPQGGNEPCLEIPKRHSLYCENHIPSWLKRARNGKSRIVSKEVFIELLKDCNSREKKLQLHLACELFYRLFKSILSLRNPVPQDAQFQWAISEASKDTRVGEFLTKLVCSEKERLKQLWGFGEVQNVQASTSQELVPSLMQTSSHTEEIVIKCKICLDTFFDDQALGRHWMDNHKKEAQWLFRGYVCAICLDSFTNKKVLEAHVQERHHVQFVEQCMLLQCIPCGNHYGNPDQLWQHVFSNHPSNLKLSIAGQQQEEGYLQIEPYKSVPLEQTKSDNQSGNRRFICRFCGLRFDLLPDLGRHHQAAHMGQNSSGPRLTKTGIQFYAQKLKSGRLTRPRFRKGLHSASYKIRNKSVQNLKKRIQATNSNSPLEIMGQSTTPEVDTLGRLVDSQCAAVAKLLFSEIKRTKSRPTNSEILSIASMACCKLNLQRSLEAKYGILPEKMYLRAAKLCSEHNIVVEWHRDGFVCPKGCMPIVNSPTLTPVEPASEYIFKARSTVVPNQVTSEWTMDECHCVLDSRHFSMDLSEKNIILCDDISFGLESIPIPCVVDENLLNAEGTEYSFPWESFTYVTKPLLGETLVLEVESLQLGCSCGHSVCFGGTCDHVYLFNNDYEDAKDIYGKSMHGRFPYDERGRIILEEGYLVYECNQRCRCSRACQNRVLQNGVRLKLEIFKTEKKGWAVRTREAILRGTFVCEYIGEVIDENEANERRNRYGEEGCRYFYEIDAHINDMSRLIEGQVPYVIDATNYGNVSRYINHSCLPNLVNHQVLVESMDSQLAHIGFYASRDITPGEELTYDFRYKLMPGEGCQCLCGASNCRGRLY